MARDELGSLAAFMAVAETRSFTKAAGRLGTSQSALSHTIRRLEARLGTRLLTRTTRSVATTEAGARLVETLGPALQDIRRQLDALSRPGDKPAGTVRISSADHAAETILWPALLKLLPGYPDIAIEVDVDNGFVDIVADGYDAGIRLGHNLAKDMIAVPIGPPERQVIVGSPAYLASHISPRSPTDLQGHRCINRRLPTLGGTSAWIFQKDGRQVKARVKGQLAANRPELIIDAALSGHGLACMLESQVLMHLRAGSLVCVLEDWCPTLPAYHIYYPHRRQRSPAVQIVMDALRYRAAIE